MKIKFLSRSLLFLGLLLSLSFGCSQRWYPKEAAGAVKGQSLEDFPYHPLVYHLDLSILTYQLYGQSLVWSFDPYYEESASKKGSRSRLMGKVQSWAAVKGAEQVEKGTGLTGYRGPGVLSGFSDNPSHDPIIYRYDRIHPWSSNLTNPLSSWTEYLVPNEITARIKEVYVGYRKTGKPVDSVAVEKIVTLPTEQDSDARDVLLAFEGGTGDKGIEGKPASQSLMGFVLVRYHPGTTNYDIHIAFRGSRSGSGARAAFQALKDEKAKGNPDWITDLGYDLTGPEANGGLITDSGAVSRGMSTCMASIHPNLFACLKQAAEITDAATPERIFVTGHSLGGGLAQVFVSSVLFGNQYSPQNMPIGLRQWPWRQMKLVTFSAPRVGDAAWAKKLTIEGLSSDFFSTAINPYDRDALKPTDTEILARLMDTQSPSGFRVLIPSDPITTEKIPGGKHVGKTVYVSKPRVLKIFSPPDLAAHEPINIRKQLFVGLNDGRIPAVAWKKWGMTDLNPNRDKSKKGTPEEYAKLVSTIERYYRENGIYFDSTGFKADFSTFLEIYKAD
jgi:hypothetical protein